MQKLCKVAFFHKQLLGRYFFKMTPNWQAFPKCTNSSESIESESSQLKRLAFQKISWHSPSLASHRMTKVNKQYLLAVNMKNHCKRYCWFRHDSSPRTVTRKSLSFCFQCAAWDRGSWQWWKALRGKGQLKWKLIYFLMWLGFFSPLVSSYDCYKTERALKIKWQYISDGCD